MSGRARPLLRPGDGAAAPAPEPTGSPGPHLFWPTAQKQSVGSEPGSPIHSANTDEALAGTPRGAGLGRGLEGFIYPLRLRQPLCWEPTRLWARPSWRPGGLGLCGAAGGRSSSSIVWGTVGLWVHSRPAGLHLQALPFPCGSGFSFPQPGLSVGVGTGPALGGWVRLSQLARPPPRAPGDSYPDWSLRWGCGEGPGQARVAPPGQADGQGLSHCASVPRGWPPHPRPQPRPLCWGELRGPA